ncbi:uncharacterized protein BYT42DRAFT_609775 [Radiomyces spectabilis]|uniref:uncharacterized protein n=1 Tax=Radiomyces spectabilis TaxID=64574 RepID=UPI00222104A5|nr:uncharacterized protein BYT42DRAFT_609775 [Radiomyces spectabilis]KAI8394015.1 hypothetical protein BYT42DRAFT_609775 [Radiomyces spectabilis]
MDNRKKIFAATEGELQDMQRKEVTIGENSVLLAKLDGKYYATSNKCTHYGAKLTEGTFSSDGRIMCKWHGACFNVKTGDIEDAPALDNLVKFEVSVEDGNVYVHVNENVLEQARQRPRCVKRDPTESETVVIIGGGASGAAAAQKLREEGFKGRIRIVSREDYYTIDRIKLSKQFGIDDINKITLRPKSFWDDLDVEFQLNTDAVDVKPELKQVLLSNADTWTYDHLILASGGWPKKLGLSGENLNNVFTIRMVQNNQEISKVIEKVKNEEGRKANLVIVGSSFIGMEYASAANDNANVTVVGKDKIPFTAVLGERIGSTMMKFHESKGVNFVMGVNIVGFKPKANDPSAVGFVSVEGHDDIPADLVLMAVGVAPQTDYIKSSKLSQAEDGSLEVDQYFKVKGTDNIYASGDIATFPYQHTGEKLRIEHWGFAENTGRTVAMNIMKKNRPFTHVPYFWTAHYGTTLRYAGFAKSFDDVIVQGELDDLEKLSFVGYFAKGDTILAIASYMKDPIVSYCAELLRIGKMPSASDIRNGVDPLNISLEVPFEGQSKRADGSS